jgi:4-amino-4-deoxy-L-arabinose transferase-like glycosyltransferase
MKIKSVPFVFQVLFISIFGMYFYHLFLNFYLDDAALYAALSETMVNTGDYISLMHNGKDWLDKPHFPFWISALFFKVFGISSFSYYLPLTLSIFVAFVYTYKLAKSYYGKEVAWLSVLILAASQYMMLSSTEGRIEPYLTLCVIAGIYHFDKGIKNRNKLDFVLVALFAAVAVMTKGVFILIPIFGGIFGHLIYHHKSISFLWDWIWLWLGAWLIIFILPEIYALYIQFDSQPEKVIFGKTNVSGIRWFLWDSQFSRLVNSGPITRSSGDPFFYVHTLLWTFFPWCFVLYGTFFQRVKSLVKRVELKEGYTLFGSVFVLLIFSISKFQLPHYTTIIFPLFSIMVADFLINNQKKWVKLLLNISIGLAISLAIGLGIYVLFAVDAPISIMITFGCIVAVTILIITNHIPLEKKAIAFGVVAILIVNSILGQFIVPEISNKGGLNAAKFINQENKIDAILVVGQGPKITDEAPSFANFYLKKPFRKIYDLQLQDLKGYDYVLAYDNSNAFELLADAGFVEINRFDHYPLEGINAALFDPQKKEKLMKKFLLFERRK